MMQIPMFEDSLGSLGTDQKEPELIHQELSSIAGAPYNHTLSKIAEICTVHILQFIVNDCETYL